MIGSEFILFSDLLVFSLELITGFAVGDFLSFAYPKERKQRKGNPDQTAFPHSNKIFLTKNQPDVRYALARRDFSKNFISIRAVWTGNAIRVNFKVRWEFLDF
ncbi:hypothetical protein ACLSY0_09050 [Avibacterium avium]|uniref:hypothetical protein n=1 Tax=Avibacterium avium TaxID=751 RepID=UPI003BF8FD1E